VSKAPNSTDKHVGSRVRMRRRMLEMSQTALGATLGISFQQVQKYETGSNRIGAGRLQQIADALRVPALFFFEELPDPNEPTKRFEPSQSPDISDFAVTSEGLFFIKAYTQIKSRKFRRAVAALIENLANLSP
jgi:transcriptional regulator with XRE-family HTH domain